MGVVSLPDLRKVKRLLIIRLSSIGDVTHALPVSAALGEAFPNLEITWVVEAMSAEVVTGNPYLRDVIIAPRRGGKQAGKSSPERWQEVAAFLGDLRRRRFDVTLDLQGRAKSGVMAYVSGAPYRFGWRQLREGSGIISKALPHRPESVHRVEWFLDTARALGAETNRPRFPFYIPEAARLRTAEMLCRGGIGAGEPYAVLNAATGNQVRRWSAECYAETARGLAQRFGLPSVLIGSEKDAALNEEIAAQATAGGWPAEVPAPLNLAGQTTIKELAAILDKGAAQICGDTGSAHIGAALGHPVIGLYGLTDPAHAGPYNQSENTLAHREICRADCNAKQCGFIGSGNGTARCLAAITVEAVLNRIEQALYGG